MGEARSMICRRRMDRREGEWVCMKEETGR